MKNVIRTMVVAVLCVAGAARADRRQMQSSQGSMKQHSLHIGLDTEVGVPLGNYADANSVGGGLSVSGEYGVADQLGATLRIGFQAHVDRNFGNIASHVNSIPMLLGAKYYLAQDHQGLFAAGEMGLFDLMQTAQVGTQPSVSQSNLKFGMGLGLGVQQNQWNAKVALHTQDVGNFGNAMMVTTSIGYQFAGL